MPRKPQGARALTTSERVTRHRQRQAERAETFRIALLRIGLAKTIREARKIVGEALA